MRIYLRYAIINNSETKDFIQAKLLEEVTNAQDVGFFFVDENIPNYIQQH